jgi:hypothetical protein
VLTGLPGRGREVLGATVGVEVRARYDLPATAGDRSRERVGHQACLVTRHPSSRLDKQSPRPQVEHRSQTQPALTVEM